MKASIDSSDDHVQSFPEISDTTEVNEIYTDCLELGPIIKELKCASYFSCGVPSIYIKVLYNTFGAYLTKPLATLLNCIFNAKKYPDIF